MPLLRALDLSQPNRSAVALPEPVGSQRYKHWRQEYWCDAKLSTASAGLVS